VKTPNIYLLLLIALVASVLAWIATFALRRWAPGVGLVDIPNERSSHAKPIPRGGGLSFVVVVPAITMVALFSSGMIMSSGMSALMLGSLLIAVVSLADDRWHMPAYVRFSAHAVGALVLMLGGGWIQEAALLGGVPLSLGWWGLPLTFIWIVGLTNAFNFMDGIDGLAAGQAVIAAVTILWLAQLCGASVLVWAMAVMAGSVLGFLQHNWPPAKIFMGDVGSAFLGFTFAGWAVISSKTKTNVLPFGAWVVVLAPFIFDTIITLVSRVARGQRWYEAHREHFYQRLIRGGWSHLAVTSLYLGVAAILGLATIAYYGYGNIGLSMFIGLVVLPLAGIVVLVRWVETRSS
jgi:UDP-N-acetylmuramyl pentapeptide phosphotransferase/UDP-N-acetylglucosamine-1-phosphate transferase